MMLWRALRGWTTRSRPRFRRASDRSDGMCLSAGTLETELLVTGLDGCGLQAEQPSDAGEPSNAPTGPVQCGMDLGALGAARIGGAPLWPGGHDHRETCSVELCLRISARSITFRMPRAAEPYPSVGPCRRPCLQAARMLAWSPVSRHHVSRTSGHDRDHGLRCKPPHLSWFECQDPLQKLAGLYLRIPIRHNRCLPCGACTFLRYPHDTRGIPSPETLLGL